MARPDASRRLEVGRIDRAHGLKGEVVVSLTTNRLERLEPGATLWAGPTALTVAASKPNAHRFIVRLEGITSREQADALRGQALSADPIEDPDELWVHELLGVEVVDVDGASIGTVASVLDNPASDLLVLESGTLIPANFVVGFDGDRLTVELPEGLLDL